MKNLSQYPYPSRRMPVMAQHMVATSQPLAAYAGLEAMSAGGNAMDAALAAAITLTVVEPVSNSIGSDLFALVWDGSALHGLNGSGKSPHALQPAHFKGQTQMPQHGWDAVTVPGAVESWVALSNRFGRLPFTQLFTRAIEYARSGFIISPTISHLWQQAAPQFKHYPEFCQAFLPHGQAPMAGDLFQLPAQAQTLELIRDSAGDAFYHGELATKIAEQAKQQKGLLSKADLAGFTPQWVDPINVRYRNVEVFAIPPNNGGLTALIALAILDQLDITRYPVDSVISLHLQLEAMKLAFMDSQQYIGDIRYMQTTHEDLLDSKRIAKLASTIQLDRAQKLISPLIQQKGTVYLTTADASGHIVSLIQSHYETFGSGIVIQDTGIGMQNRGGCFNLMPGHPNEVGGGKYPYHTIMPSFVMLDGKPLMSFGVMGGHMQPQGQLQVLSRILDYGQNPQTALDAPRWYISPTFEVSLETTFPEATRASLQALGHTVRISDNTALFGGGQIIYKLEQGYLGASDPRKDGLALGF